MLDFYLCERVLQSTRRIVASLLLMKSENQWKEERIMVLLKGLFYSC